MHNARVLRVPSTREVCIFCATRKLVAEGTSIPRAQRRHLNSSSRAPQYAQAQLYQNDSQPSQYVQSRPQTAAERQRAALQARFGRPPEPQPQTPPRSAPTSHNQYAYSRQASWGQPGNLNGVQTRRTGPAAQRAKPGNIAKRFGADTSTSGADNIVRKVGLDTPPSRGSNFRVNFDSPTPAMNFPDLNAVGHLRRRDEPRSRVASDFPPRPPVQQRVSHEGDQDQNDSLNRLLRELPDMNSRDPRGFTSLSRDRSRRPPQRSPTQSMRPDAVRQLLQENSRFQKPDQLHEPSLADSANGLLRKRVQQPEESHPSRFVQESGSRWSEQQAEKRRSRFEDLDKDESPRMRASARNRYDDMEPRRRTQKERGTRSNRIIRQEDEDEKDEMASKAERKRLRKEAKKKAQMEKEEPTPVYLPEYISVANLASLLKLRVEDFVRKLEELGFEDVQNDHILNAEHAGLIAQEYNFEPIVETGEEEHNLFPAPPVSDEEYAQLPARPPVVTIMGHVDHGKTTILDFMRSSSVVATEFGGITQHIGAFSVPLASGKKITFLDTPGHSAFETMRARGANVTDIVVLVIAADDSVKPQTVEAIKHAQAANVPIIVAINKIDKEQANPERVKQDLGRHGVEVEDYGGETQTVCLSGKTGQGIPDLEEAVSTLSEILDHRADPQANVEGWILEGSTKSRGKVATVLVRSGTLRPGDVIVAGTTWARVRSLRNETGALIEEVGPGMPVEVDGWREQPTAGDEVLQAPDEQKASSVAEFRTDKVESVRMAKDMEAINDVRRLEAERRAALEATVKAEAKGQTHEVETTEKASGHEIVPFIIKADVSGSTEAIVDSVVAVGNAEIGTRILRSGVGSPSEFDVQHAADAHGHIINFNTIVAPHISALAAEKGVEILDSNIIYRVVENVKELLGGKLPPKITQRVTGEAEVAAIFDIGLGGKKKMKVAGSKVRNGAVDKNSRVKVFRKDEVVFEGILSSLKNQKKDVDQMRKDTECGIAFDDWEDFAVGDKIQCYEEIKEKRKL